MARSAHSCSVVTSMRVAAEHRATGGISLRHPPERGPIRGGAGGEAGSAQRSDLELAGANPQPGRAVAVLVEIGMRRQKTGLLGGGQAGHAVHIMVAIAFDM